MPTGVDENISSESLIKRLEAIEERLDIIEKKLKEIEKKNSWGNIYRMNSSMKLNLLRGE